MGVLDFVASFLGGGAGAALLGFLGRDWIAAKISDAVEKKAELRRAAFEIKQRACLDALSIVDAAWSNMEWKQQGEVLPVVKQPFKISTARACFSKLALTCDNPDVLSSFAKILGLRLPGQPELILNPDTIVDLRNLMRKELKFGQPVILDRELAWISTLPGAKAE